jgi:serine/threonine protein phosphatase PrpC
MKASDIYALAVTLNEVATGVVPFSDCVKENPACHTVLDAGYGHQELAAAVVAEELRPCTTAASPPAWSQLMSHCWQAEPSLRPNAADILCHLQALAVSEGIQEPSAQVMGQNIAAKLVRLQNGQPAPANMDKTAPSLMGTVPLPTWQQEAEERKGLQPAMVAGVYADCGLRGVSCMEDRHVCANPIAGLPKGHTGPTLLAVIDGHRGNQAAEFVAGQLDVHLRNAWLHAASAEAALAAALNGCESSFATQQQAEWDAQQQRLGPHVPLARPFPGCTVVAILQVSSLIAWANIGDCRAVLCRNGKAVQLTRDHIVADVEERKRIEAAGWIVKQAPDGSLRVGKAMLEVSRSIGDLDAKGGEGQGELTSDVDTGHFWVEAEDEFLVLASDGLWDVLGNKDVVALVHDTVKNPSMAAKRLAMEALARGSTDNVTVLICFLKDVGMLERIYSAGKHTYASPAATHFGSRRAFLAALSSGHARDEICEQL